MTIKRRVCCQNRSNNQDEEMTTLMYPTIGSMFTIVTGGAPGADTLAEKCAEELGMNVKLHLTPHHHRALDAKVTPLTHTQLNKRDYYVVRASQRLNRRPTKNPFVRDLLARNWFIVHDCDVLYAYAKFEDDSLTSLEGGSGMTVQMCADHNRDYPNQWKDVFVFDESRQKWYQLERQDMRDPDQEDATMSETLGPLAFRECACAPILYKRSGLVGSRMLGALGRFTMKHHFNRTIKTFSGHQRIAMGVDEIEVESARVMMENLSLEDEDIAHQSKKLKNGSDQ